MRSFSPADILRFGQFLTDFLATLSTVAHEVEGGPHDAHAATLRSIRMRVTGALIRYELELDERFECPPALFVDAAEILFEVSAPGSRHFAIGEQTLRIFFSAQLLHASQLLRGHVKRGFTVRMYFITRDVALIKSSRRDEARELRETPTVINTAAQHLRKMHNAELAGLLARCLSQLRLMIGQKASV